jgi:16S rRNA processing protein RimM
MSENPRRILLGEIGAAHGIRGEVSVKTYTANPEDIAAYGPLSDERGRTFELTVVRVIPKGAIVRIAGVPDRTAVEKLRNAKLYVTRDKLPAPADGEYYLEDLVGLRAIGADGAHFGDVVAVQNYGAGDILEIKPLAGGATELIPFTNACVPVVDVAAGKLTVVRPDLVEGEGDAE